ncbi:tyrosine-type recombinase/integrase [Peribacillus butanolivorans]|uniref:tyrosine-type recombinase/integrase n=1 Tax=Peribacillus butanolivorans TaxID=421767 RepID=UPI00367CAEB6
MDLVNEFKNWLQNENNLSKSTIEGYLTYVRHFLNFYKEVENGKEFHQLEREMVEWYIRVQVLRFTPDATINSRIASLKKFNEFLLMKNYQDEIVITSDYRVNLGNTFEPKVVSSIDIEKFMNSIKKSGNKRDLAIATLIINTKMTVPDIVKLKVEDYDGASIRINKRFEQDEYKVDEETKSVLNQYLEERKRFYTADSDILFISHKSRAMDDKSVFRLFRKYSQLAELPTPITPKKLSLFYNNLDNFQSHIDYDFFIDEDIYLKIDFLTSNFEENLFENVKVSIWLNKMKNTFYFRIGKPDYVLKIVQKNGSGFIPKGWIFMHSLSKKDIKNALVENFYQGKDLKIKFISNLEKYSLEIDELHKKGL